MKQLDTAAIAAALQEVKLLFRRDSNITSYGIEGDGITVYVEKLPGAASIPKLLKSVPIRIMESGRVQAQAAPADAVGQ